MQSAALRTQMAMASPYARNDQNNMQQVYYDNYSQQNAINRSQPSSFNPQSASFNPYQQNQFAQQNPQLYMQSGVRQPLIGQQPKMASIQHQMENMNLSSQQQFNNSRIYNNKFQQSPQSGAQQNN